MDIRALFAKGPPPRPRQLAPWFPSQESDPDTAARARVRAGGPSLRASAPKPMRRRQPATYPQRPCAPMPSSAASRVEGLRSSRAQALQLEPEQLGGVGELCAGEELG